MPKASASTWPGKSASNLAKDFVQNYTFRIEASVFTTWVLDLKGVKAAFLRLVIVRKQDTFWLNGTQFPCCISFYGIILARKKRWRRSG